MSQPRFTCFPRFIPLAFCFVCLLLFCPVSVKAFCMFNCGGEDPPACTPDNPLVILPGPIGSPVRIVPYDDQNFIVADYSRKRLFWFDTSETLTPFIETLGKPLSVAVKKVVTPNGKLKEVYYFVGNDDDRTIDIYFDKNEQFYLLGQFPVGLNGVQALDMVFNPADDLLYVVDGLEREIKVVQPTGEVYGSFGQGVLNNPKGIAISQTPDNQKLYVSDYGDPAVSPIVPASVKVFDLLGNHDSSGTISGSSQDFSRPQGLTLSGNKLFLADSMLASILEFDVTTKVKTTTYGCRGSSDGHLLLPMDVVLGKDGQSLYTADNRNMRVTVLPLMQP